MALHRHHPTGSHQTPSDRSHQSAASIPSVATISAATNRASPRRQQAPQGPRCRTGGPSGDPLRRASQPAAPSDLTSSAPARLTSDGGTPRLGHRATVANLRFGSRLRLVCHPCRAADRLRPTRGTFRGAPGGSAFRMPNMVAARFARSSHSPTLTLLRRCGTRSVTSSAAGSRGSRR
jgi:hypothetical protein